MSHMRVPDTAEYEEVRKALLSTTPAGVSEANVYIERRSLVTARFADGQVVDMAVSRRAGSNARWITRIAPGTGHSTRSTRRR